MIKFFRIYALFFAAFLCAAPLEIAVSIEPQAYFVEKITKDRAKIYVIAPANKSPENYEPLISQMSQILKARLYFGVGIDFEKKWAARFLDSAKNLRFIDLSDGAKHDDHDEHEHDEHEHHHDPHIWLSVKTAGMQAKKIFDEISAADPKNTSFYRENLENFLREIQDLDEKITKIFAKNAQKTFLVYHPAFGFLSDEYGLSELSIEQHGRESNPRRMKNLSDKIREKNLKIIYIQPQFSQKQVKNLAKIHGLKIGVLDPLRRDWRENMLEIAEKIANEKP